MQRAEQQALTQQVREQMMAKRNVPHFAEAISVSYVPAFNDYFQLRRLAEQDLGRWLASVQTIGPQSIKELNSPDILRAGQLDRFRDQ